MSNYTNVLVAVDLTKSAEGVIGKALQVTDNKVAKFHLIHVVDYIPYMGFGEGALINPSYSVSLDELQENARRPLEELVEKLKIPNTDIIIELGTAGSEIVRYADDSNVDLIVLGSHGRHGVKLLLGSTANSVLHHAQCDVLAVRVTD